MKVKELIERLERMDPAANVYVQTQRAAPIEHNVAAVLRRAEYSQEGDEERRAFTFDGIEVTGRDVVLVTDELVKYGSMKAWEVVDGKAKR